ncbi:Carboxypeptidase regulatory-like domain-containing protein [Pseudomonas sp. IT-P291]
MPWEHRSLVISSSLADEADLLIDEKPVPPTGIDFYHREPRIVSLRPKNNSPVAGLPVALKRLIIEGLRPQDLRSEPPFDGFQTDHRWTVTGVSGAGTFRLSLAGEGMSQELDAPNCRVRSEQPSLRFYYANAGQYAPLPPEIIIHRVNRWYGVDLKLMRADGSPIGGAPVTMYRPEKEPVSGRTHSDGVMRVYSAYQYTTSGARMFEAVATLPSGEVRATYLIDVQP